MLNLLSRAREGREALTTYQTPLLEGLAVVLFPLAIILGAFA